MSNEIIINNEDIRIRPSAIVGFYSCAYQWGKTFLEGQSSIPGARASIGTAIHAGVETMWQDAITTGKKDTNLSKLTESAMEAWKEDTHDGVNFDDGENAGTAAVEIVRGIEAFVEDIAPFTQIPTAVEEFFKVDIQNPLVSELGGTVDYINTDTIADVKTSKRKIDAQGHVVQQSIYKYLANKNGYDIKHNLIQGVVLKKTGAEGMIQEMQSDVPMATGLVNGMLDTMELIAKDVAPIHHILRGNPKYYLCSKKYCSQYNTCPFVSGKL